MVNGVSKMKFDFLYNPSSIAVIGASRDPTKLGYVILENLKTYYYGEIYPVNPKADKILGLKVYKSLSELPDGIDLAVIALPSHLIPNVVEECGKKRIKGVVIISGGFKEVGEEGEKLEKEIIEKARKYGVRVVGPNCVGVYVPKTGVNTVFLPSGRQGFPPNGNIAFITQSGAFGVAVLDWASDRVLGISKFINLGNRADIDESELIEDLRYDEDTWVITLYIEGVLNGRRFMEVLRDTTPYKPIVIFKGGRSEAGGRAAKSHTGTLAGNDYIYDAVFKQTGSIRAYGMEELFDIALALSKQPPAYGDRLGIVSMSGGAGVMASDMAVALNLKVPEFSEKTKSKLRSILNPIASPHNPVDTTGSTYDEQLLEAVRVVLESGEIDILLWIPYYAVPSISRDINMNMTRLIREFNEEREIPIPVLGVATGGSYTLGMSREAEKLGIPMYISPERGVKAIWSLVKYGEWLKKRGRYKEFIEENRWKYGY